MGRFHFIDVGVLQSLESISDICRRLIFVEDTVLRRLLPCLLIEWNRGQYLALLLALVDQRLIEALLLLGDESFLEGHLLLCSHLLHYLLNSCGLIVLPADVAIGKL